MFHPKGQNTVRRHFSLSDTAYPFLDLPPFDSLLVMIVSQLHVHGRDPANVLSGIRTVWRALSPFYCGRVWRVLDSIRRWRLTIVGMFPLLSTRAQPHMQSTRVILNKSCTAPSFNVMCDTGTVAKQRPPGTLYRYDALLPSGARKFYSFKR